MSLFARSLWRINSTKRGGIACDRAISAAVAGVEPCRLANSNNALSVYWLF